MNWLFNALNTYSLTVSGAVQGYSRLFRDTPPMVIIGAITLPLLALRLVLPYWAFTIFGVAMLIAFGWITIRFIAASIDNGW